MRGYLNRIVGAAVFVWLIGGVMDAQAIKLGIKGGINQSKLRGDQVSKYLSNPSTGTFLAGSISHYETGGMFGGFIRYYFTDNFGLQLEGMWVQKGGNGAAFGELGVDFPSDVIRSGEFNGEVTANIDYIEFPLMAVYKFESDDRVNMVAEGGLVVALNTKAEVNFAGTAEVELPDLSKRVQTIDQTEDITDQVSTTDFLATIGLGFEIAFDSYDFLIEGRYTFGLTTIDATNPQSDVWNNTFAITAGFAWGEK